MSSNIKVLYEDSSYRICASIQNKLTFLHCDVYTFNKSVLKSIRGNLKEILSAAGDHGKSVFAVTKNIKFVKSLKLPFEVVLKEGGEELVVWE